MQHPASYLPQNYPPAEPILLDPTNRASTEGGATRPFSLIGNLLFGLFLAAFFLVGSIFGLQAWQSWSAFDQVVASGGGVGVEARVVNRNFSTDNKGFKHYSLSYSYQVAASTGANGKSGSYQGTSPVTQATYDSQPVGSKITIVYVPINPTVSKIPDQFDEQGQYLLLLGLALLFYVIGGVLVWLTLRNWRQGRRLKRDGQFLVGSLVSSQVVKSIGASGLTSLRIEYSFVSPTGNALWDKQSFIYKPSYHESLNLQPGLPLTVVYSDDKHYALL